MKLKYIPKNTSYTKNQTEALARLRRTSTTVSFPESKKQSLQDVHYELFFNSLKIRLEELDIQLEQLVLTHTTTDTLESLSAHLKLHKRLPVQHIILEIKNIKEPSSWLDALKQVIGQYDGDVPLTLHIVDETESISQEAWEAFASWMQDLEGSFINLVLPEPLQNTKLQQAIDNIVSRNHNEKQQRLLAGEGCAGTTGFSSLPTQKRKRPRLVQKGHRGNFIDVELQQEREQQIESEMEQNVPLEHEPNNFKGIPGLNLDEIKRQFSSFALDAGVGLITEETLEYHWHLWQGNIWSGVVGAKPKETKTPFLLSASAFQELMNHHQCFQDGLCLDHLPQGFKMIKQNRKRILHYDKNFISAHDPMAPVLTPKKPLPLLPVALCEDIIARLPATSSLRSYWEALTQNDLYPREAVFVLRQYLPQLMHCTEEMIHAFVQVPPHLQSYLLDHHPKIAELFQADIKAHKFAYARLLKECNGSAEDAAQLIVAAHGLSAPQKLQKRPHILWLLLDKVPGLQKDLKAFAKKLSFDEAQLDALLRVYAELKEPGLQALVAYWKSLPFDLLTQMHATVFKKAHTFTPMLQDEKIRNALHIIQSFYSQKDPSILSWWWALMRGHAAVQGGEGLSALVETFCSFADKIEAYGLSFYETKGFREVKSLPAALGNGLYLLKHCDKTKRADQWESLPLVSLTSTAAIRAHIDNKDSIYLCRYVIPEMQINPESYDEDCGYSFSVIEDGWINSTKAQEPNTPFDAMPLISDERLALARLRMYRFLAHHPHQLPLSFYRAMDQKIADTSFTNKEKENLYAMLALSTTGDWAYDMQPEEATKAFEALLGCLEDMPILALMAIAKKWLRYIIINGLPDKKTGLLFSVQDLLITMQAAESLFTLMERGKIIQAARHLAHEFNDKLSSAFTKGTQFLENPNPVWAPEAFPLFRSLFVAVDLLDIRDPNLVAIEQPSAFDFSGENETYFQVDKAKWQQFQINKRDQQTGVRLLSLISQFHLASQSKEENRKDAAVIRATYLTALHTSSAVDKALELLSFMDKNKPDLSSQDLIDFLHLFTTDKAQTYSEKDIQALVRQRFQSYFPEDFFLYLQIGTLPSDILKGLEDWPEEAVSLLKDLVNQLQANAASAYALPLMRALIGLSEGYTKDTLMAVLHALSYKPLLQDGAPEILMAMLDGFKYGGLEKQFIYFINKARLFHGKEKGGLLAKTHHFLFDCLPKIEGFSALALNHFEKLNFLIQMILASEDASDAMALLFDIHALAEHYPKDKVAVMLQFIEGYSNIAGTKDIPLCTKTFFALNDPELVSALCFHFRQGQKHNDPKDLFRFLKDRLYQDISDDAQKFCMQLVVLLLNNDKACSFVDLKNLIIEAKRYDLWDTLYTLYQNPPYPDLPKLLEWITANPGKESILEAYQHFDKAPCTREPLNGFDLDFAKTVRIEGTFFLDAELEAIDKAVLAAQAFSTKAIKEKLLNDKSLTDEELVALTAALLHRTKGQEGDSFEINTTQYLALYAMLKYQHAMNQVATGEGKSRITMLFAACGYALGYTVDILTSDRQLATRDYLAFKAFAKTLCPNVTLIQQNTAAESYAEDGIHFSDVNQFILFRNKARVEGKGHLVINKDPKKRLVIIDEADRLFFDLSDKRFNYSAAKDALIDDSAWIYDLLIGFFKSTDPTLLSHLYYEDRDGLNRELYAYAARHLHQEPQKFKYLLALPYTELEVWQQSAVNALNRVYEKDFNIVPHVSIKTDDGPIMASNAELIIGKQRDDASKISFGEHQCLHARLNRLKKGIDKPEPHEAQLMQALEACAEDFYIEPEKQIIYSSTVPALLQDYEEGIIAGYTGTSGSEPEKKELKNRLPLMEFLNVPPHNPSKRRDYPTYLAGDKKQHYEVLMQEILASRQIGQAVFVYCEDDVASRDFMAYVEAKLGADDADLVRIHTGLPLNTISKHIAKKAGQAHVVTITTEMIARGVHVPVHGNAKQYGIKVLVTFLPTERNLRQIMGRTARFGAEGETRLILNKSDLKRQLGKETLTDGFYTRDPEVYLKNQQQILEKRKQSERLLKTHVSDFRMVLTGNYFGDFFVHLSLSQQQEALKPWKAFMHAIDISWNEHWSMLQPALAEKECNFDLLEEELKAFEEEVQQGWEQLLSDLAAAKMPVEHLRPEVCPLQLSQDMKSQLSDKESELLAQKSPVYAHYDKAHAGRAVLYSRPNARWEAWLNNESPFFADFEAWVDGRGILFPNLQAWWQGALRFDELILGKRMSKEEGYAELIMRFSLYSMEFFAVSLAAASVFVFVGIPVFGQLSIAALIGLSLTVALTAVLATIAIEFIHSTCSSLPAKPSQIGFFEPGSSQKLPQQQVLDVDSSGDELNVLANK